MNNDEVASLRLLVGGDGTVVDDSVVNDGARLVISDDGPTLGGLISRATTVSCSLEPRGTFSR